jgi:oxygen-independent coproporphyrinogen III oxidase
MRGLYIHIPFCEHKCVYCDFYSIEQSDGYDRFVTALIREMQMTSERYGSGDTFTSVFFGGGTPSLLSPAQLERIVHALTSVFSVAPEAEWTAEANPGTVDRDKLKAYRAIGINRLSIGVQSFASRDLAFLTRIHSAEDARRSVTDARRAGFENLSIDLIFSLPGQSVDTWTGNLREAILLEPDHIASYSLTYEPGTELYRMLQTKQVTPVPDDDDASLYEHTMETLEGAGYRQYEISNYALPGRECVHNVTYWNHEEYIGFGPSAHSYRNGYRYWNVRSVDGYLARIDRDELPRGNRELLTTTQLVEEEIFLGLRWRGIDLNRLQATYRYDLLAEKGREVQDFVDRRLVYLEEGMVRLTRSGKSFADMIAAELM